MLHAMQGAAYQTGDFRDYLPPEAGGRARPGSAAGSRAGQPDPAALGTAAAATAGGEGQQQQQQQQRLGHILYVRDSASEPEDSDEDPDDDLDI